MLYYESSPPYTKPMPIQTLRSMMSSELLPKLNRCRDLITLSIRTKKDYDDCMMDRNLTSIKSLQIYSIETLSIEPTLSIGMFRCLRKLDIRSCNGPIVLRNLHIASPNLRTLILRASCVTDCMMKDIVRLKSLEHLDLCMSRGLTDVGLGYIAQIQTLEILNLSCSRRITDCGVRKLLTQIKSPLHSISISECCQLSEYCFANIQNNLQLTRSLKVLDISRTSIKRLESITKFRQLTSLNLTSCDVVDFAPIATMHRLQYLGLRYCFEIQDSDLNQYVATLTELRRLELEGCYQITYDGVERIGCVEFKGRFHRIRIIRWVMGLYEYFQYPMYSVVRIGGIV